MHTSLILYAEHEFNASTFTARVVAGTGSDMFSAITAAIGALKGPKHGGANEVAYEIQQRYRNPEQAEADIRERIGRKEIVIGFGHPVYTVSDPRNAIIQVEKFIEATSQLAQTTLRSVLGKHELDQLLSEREQLNLDIQTVLDQQTDAWGIKVSNVEIKHVDLNETMVRAIARQAEAERERRAKVIHAEGELQAAEKLLQAAETLAQRAEAMQLRYLQTLTQIAGDKASTIVFPVPMDVLGPLLRKSG